MSNLNYAHCPLRTNNTYSIDLNGDSLIVRNHHEFKLTLNDQHQYSMDVNEETQSIITEALFGAFKELATITINNENISRYDFYQSPLLWLRSKEEEPEVITQTGSISHPVRPHHFHGTHYRRFVPSIGKTISFRTITLEDLDTFHQWHNQERVSFFWELDKEREELKDYIIEGLEKKHQIPMIVEVDGVATGYYEFYWVKEDRLGPYYQARPYDRGFHFLIGEQSFLGKENTAAILQSGLHFIYLDHLKTQFTMAEPRFDNNRVLKYADTLLGWQTLKVFDFPHKRAVLLENSRDGFFKGARL